MVNGRIKQSIVFWCFNVSGEKWDAERTCQVAKQLGVTSIEIIGPEHWPTLKKHGLDLRDCPQRHARHALHARVSTIPSITTK